MTELASPEIIHRVKEYYEIRFGIEPELFKDHVIYTGPRGRIFLGPETSFPLEFIDSCGILIARIQRTVKPTTNFLQLFGKHVKQNHIVLNKEQCINYCKGEDFILTNDSIGNATRGFVMVSYNNIPLGCALFKEQKLFNQLPSQNRIKLKYL